MAKRNYTKKVEGLTIKEGMTLNQGERVEVYYNLQQGGFSIKALDKVNPNKGKVVAYAENVLLENCTFNINKKKLDNILDKERKTVYAVVRGYFVNAEGNDNSTHKLGYCNPFKTGKFIDWNSREEITAANEVYFYDKYFSYQA